MPELGSLDGPRGCWEWHALAALEDGRLVLVRDGRVHDRRVPVTLHVLLPALNRAAPGNVASPSVGLIPGIAMEARLGAHGVLVMVKGYESVAKATEALEISGKINEAVLALEAFFVKDLQEVCASERLWHVTEHEGGTSVSRWRTLLSLRSASSC